MMYTVIQIDGTPTVKELHELTAAERAHAVKLYPTFEAAARAAATATKRGRKLWQTYRT